MSGIHLERQMDPAELLDAVKSARAEMDRIAKKHPHGGLHADPDYGAALQRIDELAGEMQVHAAFRPKPIRR